MVALRRITRRGQVRKSRRIRISARPSARWTFGVAVSFWLILAGCSVESRYRTVSFLFDGVEHPDSVRAREARMAFRRAQAESLAAQRQALVEGRATSGPRAYVHPPYEEGDCSYCHLTSEGGRRFAGAVELIEPVQTLCVGCHDDKSSEALAEEFAWVHGPVAAGQCTGCHSPHQSVHPSLLKVAPGPALCLRCHDKARLALTPLHERPTSSPCLDCHGAHGAESRGRADTLEEAFLFPESAASSVGGHG
jgi:predicted CXXCH cytochrome family protein